MNDPNRMVTVLEVDDSEDQAAAERHKKRMAAMQADGERSAGGQTRAFETMHERLVRLADRTEERHRTFFRSIEQMAERTARGIASVADAGGRAALKMAELVGAIGVLTVAGRRFFDHLRGGEVDLGRHGIAVSNLVNIYRGARLALSPTLFTAGTLGAGILGEYALSTAMAQARQTQSDALLAARSGRSFQNVSTIGMAGMLSGEGRGQFQSLFGRKSPSEVVGLVGEFQQLKDPLDQANFAVKNFGDKAEQALPLLRDRLKENIERAYELSTALDSRTRTSLQQLAREMHEPVEALKEMASWFRNVRAESQLWVSGVVADVHEVLHATQGFTDIRAARSGALLRASGLTAPEARESDGAFLMSLNESFGEDSAAAIRRLQGPGARLPLDPGVLARSTRAMTAFEGDGTLAGLHRREGTAERQLEAAMQQLKGAQGTPFEGTVREGIARAGAALADTKAQITRLEIAHRLAEDAMQKRLHKLATALELDNHATSKMLEGAVINSRAGQFDTSVPSFASEALQSFTFGNVARSQLPFFLLPRRKSQDQYGAELVGEESLRQAGVLSANERNLSAFERQSRFGERAIGIQGTSSRQIIEDTYAHQVNAAARRFELEKQIIGEAAAGYQQEARADEARIQREEELMRLTRDRFDLIKRESSALLQTLFHHPGQFGGQLLGTIGSAALNPVINSLSTAAAGWLSPMFGGSTAGAGVPVMPGAGNGVFLDSPSSMIGGAGDWGNGTYVHPGGGGTLNHFSALFGRGGLNGLTSTLFNRGNIYMGPWSGTNAAGIGGFAGTLAGIASSPAAIAGGGMLAQFGLTGNTRGTFGGTFLGAAGGALAGFGLGAHIGAIGGPIGAAIGAGAGLLIGLGEQIAGVEPPSRQAHRLIMDIYHVDIPERSGIIQQIIALSQQFGNMSTAVRSSQARQLIEMYALALGRSTDLFLGSPRSASLVQQGNTLYQGLNYFNGAGYGFASSLPTLGPSSGTIPTSSPFGGGGGFIQLDGPATTSLLRGQVTQVATPQYVGGQNVAALRSGGSRFATTSAILAPSTIFA